MKKLYIPTSTLNFNNIMSSETISPKSFYAMRRYGSHRWYSVMENDNDNCVLLYESLASFDRPASDLEDHPMLVEIYADETVFQHYADGVLYSDKTIYLDPWHTSFIFFDENVKRNTFSMSDNFIETKLVKLYTRYSRVVQPETNYSIPSYKEVQLNECEVANDYRLNKMKGLLYGYYIGALLSSSKEYVSMLTDLKNIRNIFSAVLSHPEHKIAEFQKENLDILFDRLRSVEPEYVKRQGRVNELFAKLNERAILNNASKGVFESIFNSVFPESEMKLSFNKDLLIHNLQTSAENNTSLRWINQRIDAQEQQRKVLCLLPQNKEISVSNNEVSEAQIITDAGDQVLFKEWCNKIFISEKYDGKISTFNRDLAKEITQKARDIYQENWNDNNPTRIFLNKLLQHIAGDKFDVKWDNNGLLYSIASVLTNGNEWDKLLAFMQSNGMFDYRLAFAIFGELNGFANLPRDFTDILFERSSDYITIVYKEFYKQLFGKELESQTIVFSQEKYEQERTIEPVTSASNSSFAKTIRKTFDECKKGLHNQDKLAEEMEKALMGNGNNEDLSLFLTCLAKYPCFGKKTTAWKRMQQTLCPDSSKMVASEKKQDKNPTLPLELPVGLSFYCDSNVWSHISSLLPNDNKIKKQIYTDLLWFQNNHKESYYDSKNGNNKGIYYGKTIDNENTINRYRSYLLNKRNNTEPEIKWLADIYLKVDIDAIINKLKALYNVK